MSRLTFIPILFAGFLLSCGDSKTAAAPPKPVEEEPVVPQNRFIDDVSRYLAGLPAKPGSKIADLHETQGFKVHMADFDTKWAVFEQERREKMEKFQQSELSGSEITGSTLLYAFGGPDVLTAHTFFPKNQTYVLMGLEPPGGLPSEEIKDALGKLRIGASATLKLNRKDFGINYNKMLETGGVIVGDEVTITLDVQLVKK